MVLVHLHQQGLNVSTLNTKLCAVRGNGLIFSHKAMFSVAEVTCHPEWRRLLESTCLGSAGGPASGSTTIAEMEQLVQQVQGAQWQYAWLPTGAVQGLVCCLAATILRPPGKFAQAIPYFCQGQQAIDDELRRHHIGMQVACPACTVCRDLSLSLCGCHSSCVDCFLQARGAWLPCSVWDPFPVGAVSADVLVALLPESQQQAS